MVSQIAIPTSEQEQELVEQVDKALLVVENPVDYLLGVAKREIFVYFPRVLWVGIDPLPGWTTRE
jgi:hypothetical protein